MAEQKPYDAPPDFHIICFSRVNGKQRFPRVRRIYYDTNEFHGEDQKPYSVLYCNHHAALLRDNGNDSEDEEAFVEDCTWLRFPGRRGRKAISKPGSHVPDHSNAFVENDGDSIISTDEDSDDSDLMSDSDSSDDGDLSSADSIEDDEVGELDDDICKIGKSDHEINMSRKEILKEKADEKERKRKKKDKRKRRREMKRQRKLRKDKKNGGKSKGEKGEKRKREPTKAESARDRLEKRLAGKKMKASAGAGPSLGGPSRPGGNRSAVGKAMAEAKKRPMGLAREPERYVEGCIKKEEKEPKEEKPKPKKGPIKLMNLFNGKGVKWN